MVKGKLFAKVASLTFSILASFFTPMVLLSCGIKTSGGLLDEGKNGKSFFNDVVNNTSYYFSFNAKDDSFLPFDSKNNYSILAKCKKDEIGEFQKQKKFFVKFKCSRKFYLEKVGIIFCLPLITKVDTNILNENIKKCQKDLFEFPVIDTNNKNNNDEIKEIIIKFSKKQLEKISGIKDFNVGQKEYEIIFIVSIFSKSLSFEKIEDLEKQKNNVGARNANIFLRLKLEKNTNN
ncbi:hypothetical protein IJR75_02760 [bacterium]|nr:hypothetical protein [bacterium]